MNTYKPFDARNSALAAVFTVLFSASCLTAVIAPSTSQANTAEATQTVSAPVVRPLA